MRTMHLFAGAGGGLLGDLILGHTPVVAVEWDKYCCSVLRERAAEGWFPDVQVHEEDIRMFDPSEYKGRVDCIHAGFPCQPHSVAGKRKGEADERNLWPDTARIIGDIRPQFVMLENVPGIVSTGYVWTVIGDLAEMGYDARWGIISAAEVGAPHRRERWWCFAKRTDTDVGGRDKTLIGVCCHEPSRSEIETGEVLANTNGNGLQRRSGGGSHEATGRRKHEGREVVGATSQEWGYWEIEPDVGRVANGVASRVDKLKALGNGQVPLQEVLAWELLKF